MKKGTYRIVKGDVTEPQRVDKNERVIIPHVCNNLGGFGAGFALALSKKWPVPEKDYKKCISSWRGNYSPEAMLGRIASMSPFTILIKVSKAGLEPDTYVANMVAQDGYKSIDNPKPLKYWALVECMRKVAKSAKANFTIHCPKFGSLRGGGNFDFIEELIKEIWIDSGIDVTVYEYEK